MEYEATLYQDASIVGMIGGILIVEGVCESRYSGLESNHSLL